MRNYMLHRVLNKDYTPRFNRPYKDHVITGNHVAQLFLMSARSDVDRPKYGRRAIDT